MSAKEFNILAQQNSLALSHVNNPHVVLFSNKLSINLDRTAREAFHLSPSLSPIKDVRAIEGIRGLEEEEEEAQYVGGWQREGAIFFSRPGYWKGFEGGQEGGKGR